jgi:hypothetical protein
VYSDVADDWSNVMHYLRPADFVRNAIPHLLEMSFGSTEAKQCIAWLFGYTAHIVADYTIHPVVAERVGPYSKKTAAAHRKCECNQDAYIFNELTHTPLAGSDFLAFTGMRECTENGNLNKLNSAVKALWKDTLQDYKPEEIGEYVRLQKTRAYPPKQAANYGQYEESTLDPDNWFATYLQVWGKMAVGHGFSIPKTAAIDPSFIEELKIPESSKTIHFDDLFAKARRNISAAWVALAKSLKQDDRQLFTLENASLDEGRNQNGKLIYWS